MASKVQTIVGQGKSFWGTLKGGPKLALVAGGMAAIGVVLYLTLRGQMDPYQPFATGLSTTEAKAVEDELDKAGIPYQRDAGGAMLKVPAGKIFAARVLLASQGVAHKGVGYEIFDKQSFGTSSMVEQMNYLRARQGELERSLVTIDVVQAARVHLAISERSLYRNDTQAPSASVVVRLAPGRALSAAQVRGIVSLVSFSVPGLLPERVSLVDETGRVLSDQDAASGGGTDAQRAIEETLRSRVLALLERVVGEGHAEVQISAEMDFSKETTQQELYDKDGQVVRSEQRTANGNDAGAPIAAGVAGTQGNLPGAPAPQVGGAGGGTGNGVLAETKNYEISKTIKTTQGMQPKLNRLHLAILVDGVPDKNAKPKKGKEVPRLPLTAAELAQLGSLAKQAVGYDDKRGDTFEIQSSAFLAPPPLQPTPPPPREWPAWARSPRNQLLMKGIGLFLAIVAGFAALVVLVRSVRLRRQDQEAVLLAGLPANMSVNDMEEQIGMGQLQARLAAAGAASAPPPMQLPAAPSVPKPRDLALASAKRDMTRSVRVLSNWLTEPGAK